MDRLQLPPTVRHVTRDECPGHMDYDEYWEKTQLLNLRQGYIVQHTDAANYSFFAEINIDNNQLWDLFKALTLLIPYDTVGLILGYDNDDPTFWPYKDKYFYLNYLDPYSDHLVKDGFLEFGLIYSTHEDLFEVFVKSYKYLQVWGKDIEGFSRVMEHFGLNEVPDLDFIDSVSVATVALSSVEADAQSTHEVFELLTRGIV